MYTVSKEFNFSASHQQLQLPADNICTRLHGHSYRVQIELQSQHLNEYGFVFDYKDFLPVRKFIDDTLDHRHLNDVMPENTSAEAICKYIYTAAHALLKLDEMPHITMAVRVSETEKTWAEYRP